MPSSQGSQDQKQQQFPPQQQQGVPVYSNQLTYSYVQQQPGLVYSGYRPPIVANQVPITYSYISQPNVVQQPMQYVVSQPQPQVVSQVQPLQSVSYVQPQQIITQPVEYVPPVQYVSQVGQTQQPKAESQVQYYPQERIEVEYEQVQRSVKVPVTKYYTDYVAVETQTEYIPQVQQQYYTEYIPQEKTYTVTEYTPVQRVAQNTTYQALQKSFTRTVRAEEIPIAQKSVVQPNVLASGVQYVQPQYVQPLVYSSSPLVYSQQMGGVKQETLQQKLEKQ